MQAKDFPFPDEDSPKKVLFMESGDAQKYNADQIISEARRIGAARKIAGQGWETFWIVFETNPERVWDLSERAIRHTRQC